MLFGSPASNKKNSSFLKRNRCLSEQVDINNESDDEDSAEFYGACNYYSDEDDL